MAERRGLRECISHCVIHGAVHEANRPCSDDPAGPVVWHVDVLGLQAVLMVAHGRSGCVTGGKWNGKMNVGVLEPWKRY